MDSDTIPVINSLVVNYHYDNASLQGECSIINQFNLNHMNKFKTTPTPLEYSWCSRHLVFVAAASFSIFVCIAMTAGVLIVCLTSSKERNQTCDLTFKRTAAYSIGDDAHPVNIAVGDFNKDKHLDLVVANYGTDSIGILLGLGRGVFENQTTYSTGFNSHPFSVVVADFNNDKVLDIASANSASNSIGVFLGYGNGSFQSQILFSLCSSRPLAMTTGDFNNDNQSDIAVVNYGTSTVAILLSLNNGSFQIQTFINMGYNSIPYSIVVADFNNDNQLDIATANFGTNRLAILLSNGNGTFVSYAYSTGIDSHSTFVAVGDFNKDKEVDIAVANANSKNVYIFLGYGNGTFTNTMICPIGSDSHPQSIVISDLNNDANLDIIVASLDNDKLFVLKGDGNGVFSIITTQSTGFNSGPSSMAVGDFDEDNQLDIAITSSLTNNVLILTSYIVYPDTVGTTYSTGADSQPYAVALGDFNNDHRLDIVVANANSSTIGILLGLGNGTFGNQKTYFTGNYSQPKSVATGDFNNDHHLDIIVGMFMIHTIGIYLGHGDGTFEYTDTYLVEGSYPFSVAVGDFNNDKNLDIVTSMYGNSSAGIFLGYGNGTFTIVTTYSTRGDSNSNTVAVGNFNNDSLLDFTIANYRTATISIHLGYGNGSFRISMIISTDDNYPSCIVVGDMNRDTHLDLAFSDPYSSSVVVLLGSGNGTFGSINEYSIGAGSYPWSIALGYFDNDTLLDIAVTNQWDFSIGILVGYGNGSFKAPVTFPTGFYSLPSSIAFGDFNNDNQSDIVVSNYGTNEVDVFLVYYAEDFTDASSYIIGSRPHPYSVVVGNFNNKNQLDMAVANSGNDNVQILLDYNQGNFTHTTIYSTGYSSHPQYVTTADINKDGHLDIAVANYWNSNINVFFGFGNGTFDKLTQHSTGYFPSSIIIDDFKKDNWLDAVVANQGSDNIGVFYGFDYPTFINYNIRLSTRILIPFYMIAADFNNNQRLDIAVAHAYTATVGILLGYGNGTFTEQVTYSTGSGPASIAVGDFNHDNHLDIAVANSEGSSVSIFLGYGNGTFAQQMLYSTNSLSSVSIAVGDFNNDNNLEIVVANKNSDSVGIFFGYENGTFSKEISYWLPTGSRPVWVAVHDLDNDSIQDIAIANSGRNEIGVLFGYGNGSFKNVRIFFTSDQSYPCSVAIEDLNTDGFMDIAVANQPGHNVDLLFGYGNGTFSFKTTLPLNAESYLISIAIGDLNNDSALDIAVTDWGGGYGNITVFYGFGNGEFTILKTYSTGRNSYPLSISICDFDNDSQIDLATSISNTANIIVMLRYKSTPFSTQTIFPTGIGSRPASVIAGDFDSDDQLDIAVANSGTNNVGIFFGSSDGIFGQQMIYSTGEGSNPNSIAMGDFDSDHHLDIAIANFGTDNVGILFGYGNRSFRVIRSYFTGKSSAPSSIAIADMNKDKHLDLVVANWGINNILVLFGSGDGSLLFANSYSVGYGARPQAVTIGDFNNDSWFDIAVANYGTDYVEILVQAC